VKEHTYTVSVTWTGNRGVGTSGYRDYGRDHLVSVEGKPVLEGSSDRAFFGDVDRWNPEDMLVAALSQCHMLSFLHVAADAGVVVTAYSDQATGTLVLDGAGGGAMSDVLLRPSVEVLGGHKADLDALHDKAHHLCFIANSVNFPVRHASSAREVDSL